MLAGFGAGDDAVTVEHYRLAAQSSHTGRGHHAEQREPLCSCHLDRVALVVGTQVLRFGAADEPAQLFPGRCILKTRPARMRSASNGFNMMTALSSTVGGTGVPNPSNGSIPRGGDH